MQTICVVVLTLPSQLAATTIPSRPAMTSLERRYRKLTEHDDRRSPKKRGADIGKSGHGSVIADKNPEARQIR